MTKRELQEIIETTVEQKLLDLLGDPDEGLPLRKQVRDRLLRQKQAVAAGERGKPFKDVVVSLFPLTIFWKSFFIYHQK